MVVRELKPGTTATYGFYYNIPVVATEGDWLVEWKGIFGTEQRTEKCYFTVVA